MTNDGKVENFFNGIASYFYSEFNLFMEKVYVWKELIGVRC